jgi:hypothetical protein
LIVEGQGKPGMWVALVILAAMVVWSIWQSKKDVSPGMG